MCPEPNGHGPILNETNHVDGPIAETVIDAITEVIEGSSTEIEPLYESIDPDALDDLFDRRPGKSVPTRVEFRHKEFSIAIEESGRVVVYDAR